MFNDIGTQDMTGFTGGLHNCMLSFVKTDQLFIVTKYSTYDLFRTSITNTIGKCGTMFKCKLSANTVFYFYEKEASRTINGIYLCI